MKSLGSYAIVLAGLCQPIAATATPPAGRTIAVEDLARFAELSHTASHDGGLAAIVLSGGNPQNQTNDARLLLYRTADFSSNAPLKSVARFASATNDPPIALVQWLAGGQALAFAATNGMRLPQVYRVDMDKPTMHALTNLSARLVSYDVTPSGARLVTFTEAPEERPEKSDSCLRRGCRVTEGSLMLAERWMTGWSVSLVAHDLRNGGSKLIPPPQILDPDIDDCDPKLEGGLAKDGRFGLRACLLKPGRWPQWWNEYTADHELRSYLDLNNNMYAEQLLVIDFEKATSRRLSAAPWIWNSLAPIWIDDGRRLALVGALEPLSGVHGETRAHRASTRAILVMDPVTGESERIGTLDGRNARVSAAQWNEETRTLIVRTADATGAPLPAMRYRSAGKHWVAEKLVESTGAADAASTDVGVQLVVEQSLNDPPILVALDAKTHIRKTVLDPNPWLKRRRLGRVQAITWNSKDGRVWKGGLYYPPSYQTGRQYPLLIQTHGFNSERFALQGVARNFVAQPLAAHDVLVLQAEENLRGAQGPSEWPAVQAGYEAAVDHLASLGLIDRSRVGIVGWSRTGPHAGYTLTHSTYPFAAAAFTSTGGHGYWWYVAMGGEKGGSSLSLQMEGDYGAPPYGAGLATWQKFAPDFNFERLHTPLLMWENAALWGLWDWYAGLKRLDKPVEYWYLPDGEHDLFKIGERLLTHQLLVDWFRFWLKGEEDADPARAAQYARWRELIQDE